MRKKVKDLPKILRTPVSRPDYYAEDEVIWRFLNSGRLLTDFEEQEKALFEYMNVPYTKITDPNIQKLIHSLAVYCGMKGFEHEPFPTDEQYKGEKGLILYLRMQRLYLSSRDSLRNCADKICKTYKGEYYDDAESVYSEYMRVKKTNKAVKQLNDISLEEIDNLLSELV